MEDDGCLRVLSDTFYRYANKRIGSAELIMKRQMMLTIAQKMREIAMKKKCPHDHILSGSKSEGFDFITSDHDEMIVYNGIIVRVNNDSNNPFMHNETVLIMETDQTRPGFCLLRLDVGSHASEEINKSCVQDQNGVYVSSALWRNEVKQCLPESEMHGPCENGFFGDTEVDIAHCLKLTKWPASAFPCIERLTRAGWPSCDVLAGIVRTGCHVVAIGDKVSDKEIIEWRISFSEAEKTLIHEMNHCQFLCYGLLKIFLKEVINTREDVDRLLCSYFIKTTVLWEISSNRSTWNEKDFLKWFWKCFRRLLSWVKNGYCPNFFIPENNMFLGKIYGRSQQILLHHLTSLYNQGYACIPVCQCEGCMDVLCFPQLYQCAPSEIYFTKEPETDMYLIHGIYSIMRYDDISTSFRQISWLQYNRRQSDNNILKLITDILLNFFMQNIFFCSAQQLFLTLPATDNKTFYKSVRKCVRAIKEHKFDLISHKLLSAILLYKFGMYKHALRIVLDVRGLMQRTHVMYSWTGRPADYKAAGGEYYSVDVMMKMLYVDMCKYDEKVNLQELSLEYQYMTSITKCIHCPPLVFINFLLYLSLYRLSMYSEADSVLYDLTTLINNDNGYHIYPALRAISWEILGICQEISGYHIDAYLSYHKALSEPGGNHLRLPTNLRLLNLMLNALNNI